MITINMFDAFRHDKELGFNLIYRVCREPLAKFAFRLTRRADVAQDITSDAFLLLWKMRRQFKSELHIKRFLYRVVFNLCQTERRGLHRRFVELPPHWDEIDQEAAESALLEEIAARNRWMMDKIRLLLAELPNQQAQDYKALVFDSKTYKDIARERRIRPGTVRRNVLLAATKIQSALETNTYPGYSKNS